MTKQVMGVVIGVLLALSAWLGSMVYTFQRDFRADYIKQTRQQQLIYKYLVQDVAKTPAKSISRAEIIDLLVTERLKQAGAR
jgi:hypothetical protein